MVVAWNARLRRQTVHAVRPIRAGEELLNCFFGVDGRDGLLRAERQALLQQRFGFDCACHLCGLTGVARERSEARQRRLKAIGECVAASPPPSHARMTKLLRETSELARDEGAPEYWQKGMLLRLVGSAADVGDAASAERWARKAATCTRDACGDDSDEYLAILQ